MPALVGYGDRIITTSGRPSWLKRPSVPIAQFGRDGIPLAGDGRILSFLHLYESQPWVAVVVNKLSRQIVRLPLRLYRQLEENESEPVYEHPLADLLRSPWRRCSPANLKQKLSFPALVHGNAVLAKVRGSANGPPTGFVPLDWRFLTPYALDDGEIFFWECSQPNREPFYASEDVVHVAFDAGNGDLGLSPLKQLGITLRTEDSAQRYQSASFENGARPSGALVLPADARLKSDERRELRDEIRNQHGRVDANFNIALLSGGMDWKPFSHTAVEAELIEQRKLNREEVAAVYDVDPPMIGILDHATYSNVTEMHKMLYGATLGPWLSLIADTLNAQVINSEPRWMDERLFVAFDLSEVLRSNTKEEIEAISTAIGTGIMTPNEGRQRLRARRVTTAGADDLYMPTNNMTPMGQPPPEPVNPPENPPDEPEEDDPVKKNCLRAMERAAKKMSSSLPPWDRERFIMELNEDAPLAPLERVADLVEGLIRMSEGDPAACRALARSRFASNGVPDNAEELINVGA